MKTKILQKMILTLSVTVLFIVAISTHARATTTYTFYAKPYFGDTGTIPGNGTVSGTPGGGTVSLSWSGSTSSYLATDASINSSNTDGSSKNLTVKITPTAGTYRILSVKMFQNNTGTAPTSTSSWNEVSDTSHYNASSHYDITLPVSRNGSIPYSKYTYYWVVFEPITYSIVSSIVDDTPACNGQTPPCSPLLAHCSATASLVEYLGGVETGTEYTYPSTLTKVVNPNGSMIVKIKNSNSDCEIYGLKFESGSYILPTTASTPTSLSGSASGSTYTTPSITTAINNATVAILFKHKGYTITVTKTDTTPSCGSVSPVDQNYEAGETQIFTFLKNTGCAIESVTVDGTDVTGAVTSVTNPTGVNTYNFANIQANHTIAITYVKVSTTLGAQYCQRPAFMLEQATLKPNVLMILDNSGSMGGTSDGMGLAYRVTGKTYGCTTTSPNTTIGSGTCKSYYGYFEPSKMYKLSGSNYIISTATLNLATTSAISTTVSVSGNYLNYYNAQKIDILRKILVGGRVAAGSGADRGTTGSTFYLSQNDGKIVEYGTTEPQGIVHTLYDKVRFGIMTFNDNGSDISLSTDGGHIAAKLGSSLTTLVSTIEGSETDPGNRTPLAESLYEAVRYYEAKSSAFNSTNYGTQNTVASGVCTAWNGCPSTDSPPELNKIIQYSCQKNFVLMVTDGEPTNDENIPGNPDKAETVTDTNFSLSTWWNKLAAADKTTGTDGTKYWLPAVAYYAHNTDLRSTALSNDMSGTQNLSIYTVYAFGTGAGTATLTAAAKYGAYIDTNKNAVPDAGEFTNGYYAATDGEVLETKLKEAFSNIMDSAGSGTAAAVANNKSGERGANIIQALFYPQWPNDTTVKWLGEMQALWYYLDPFIGFSNIYEDTVNDKILNLLNDKSPTGDAFSTKSLWRAGAQLQKMLAADRKIYTPLTSSVITDSSNEFKTTNLSTLRGTNDYMNLGSTTLMSDAQATRLVNYIRGTDYTEYRPRKVLFTDPVTNALNTSVATEWKLGDIINSTPQVQSSIALNSYDRSYSDLSYKNFISSDAYKARNIVYSGSNDGLMHAFRLGVVTNLNDGAHQNLVASIKDLDTTTPALGKEEWAFIPKNALPYLQNQSGTEYCHQCLVDGVPTVVDVSIFPTSSSYWDTTRTTASWGTVLISGMGLGGATRDMGILTDTSASAVLARNCNETVAHDSDATNNKDCVKTPKTGIGLSSYFALDVSTPLIPKFMWEFSDYSIAADTSATSADKGLGFTTSGSTIVRTNAKTDGVPDKTKNGRWFAVFASGPTGTLNQSGGASDGMFRGHSDQNLKIYIVDLNATMPFTKGTNYWVKDTGIKYAFANSLLGSVVDLDRSSSALPGYYSDDVVYVTYTKASLTSSYPSSDTAWDKGGVVRLVTNNDPNPANWFVSHLIGENNDVGPITTSIGKIQDRDKKKLWIYFGEGRFFFPSDETSVTRRFFGVQDPCYNSNNTMNTVNADFTNCPAISMSDIQDQGGTPPSVTLTDGKKGWYVTMEPEVSGGTAGAERVMADVTANKNGIVYFGTYTPNTDACTPGGTSSLWAVKYDTGGTPSAGSLVGKAPVQTSNSGITLVDLATSMNLKSGRKTDKQLMGLIGRGPISTLTQNPAIKKILHIQEK